MSAMLYRLTKFLLKMLQRNLPSQCSPEALQQIALMLLSSASGNNTPLYTNGITQPQTTISSEEYQQLLQMPLWQMTGAQLVSLGESILSRYLSNVQSQPQKHYVYGIDGLAQLIGKSKNTAQRLKSSGIIDEAISQDGRTIVIDSDLALELIHKHDMEEKEQRKAQALALPRPTMPAGRKEVAYV